MKKRILLLACALALLVGCLVMSSMAASTKTGYCEACKETVTWEPIVFGTQTGDVGAHKHYYLDKDYSHTSNQQLNVKGNSITLCVDLNGKSWYSWGRAFYANFNTKNEDYSTINIMDSVGGAVVTARSEVTGLKADGSPTGTNNTGGANIWVAEKCTVNIYGGTFALDAIESQWGLRVDNGGIASVCNGGTLNIYGGTLQGGNIKKSGGAVYLYAGGKVNICGGELKSGSSANSTGNCVGVIDSNTTPTVTLSGDAQVDDIYLPTLRTANLTVSGAFTGSANITYKSDVTLSVGTAIGTLTNSGSVTGGDLYCTNGTGYNVIANGTALQLAEPATEEVRHECPHCKTIVKWEVFPNASVTTAGTYHYYLHKDYDRATAKQFSVSGGGQVCLDLYGHNFYTTGRAFSISGTGSVLSVIDTVGGSEVNATAAGNNPGGGCVSISSGAAFNLYSGTLSFTHDPTGKWGGTGRGGVIQATGTLNVYGGKIVGGEVVDCTYEFTGIEGAGGAIYASSVLNIQGGEITSGIAPESGAGPCIYISSNTTKVTLGGDAKVDDICFTGNNSARFTVAGDFTGTAAVSFEPAIELSQGMVIALCDSKEWNGTVNCGSYTALPESGNLCLSAYPAGTVAATGGQGYTSLQAAIDAASEGALVEMLKGHTGDISINMNMTLQLNNCTINGTVTVAEGCTLYGMDSATDDYTVSDGKYGKITAVVGNVAGARADDGVAENNYLLVEEDGSVSFHCVTLQIYAMSLRVDDTDDKQEPGLFYKSYFRADEKAAPLVANYGVALSVVETPNAENLERFCSYTVFDGFESGPLGNLGNSSSSLLKGILKEKYSENSNLRNLSMPIYGRAYVKTTDGQYLFGQAVCRSLAEQLEGVDGIVPTLSEGQVGAVVRLYNQFKDVIGTLQLPGITEAVQTEEEGTLKVLVLGNSHGLDATNLLYEVFHNEAPEQKVIIAALYYSGCNMDQHDDYLTNNKKVYTYHKNDGTQPNRTWVVKDSTCLDALQDEQWDIIFMQQMNHRVAIDGNYDPSWKVVADYLLNNQDLAPKLGFHMTWTNPDDYALYLDDDAPLNNPSPTSWRNTHERYWSTDGKYDQSKQYLDITRCVKQYLVDDTSLLGRPYDMILPVATAIEYAQDVCGRPQTEIYRDYTHMNDYGRVIAAYTWYATIMELEEITEVKLDAVPAVLKHKNSKFPTEESGYAIDADMKADLIESVNWALKNPFSLPEQ